ncbi:methylenetetrahydrofolate reductase [Buchnera aphidicola]|uniref:Methylenetetrahydrofolate reductase n=1 Tax=Buchnera aphidicola (Sarucallis kahawaluokalani) TaxID=1241878 RepID=A0A4D6YLM2_9GAMM|nr:methylenetetrahydrofolate reductase [Buchnera aphidicola]QCI25845.1 5,10-methylenetetrahydrofolate reductase [Buchnera aphidicola (Sarucallis kahawaluokalani)]
MKKFYNSCATMHQNIFDIRSKLNISFEFFPPKVFHQQENNFFTAIKKLSVFCPNFISVTCSPQVEHTIDYTYQAIRHIPKELNLNIAPHITYINNIDTIKEIAQKYWNHGIRRIVALRGDIISKEYHSEVYASELVTLLKEIADFDISVAAYPEMHPEAKDMTSDLIYLKKKIDCGANRAITQFFFDADTYLRFRDRCVDIGISVDIVPGILPIINFSQLKRFLRLTNVSIPSWMCDVLNNVDNNDIYVNKMIGLMIAMNIIQKLCSAGVRNFHFYTLNNFDITYALCSILTAK